MTHYPARDVGDYYSTGQDAWACDGCGREEISCECEPEPLCMVCEDPLREDGFCEGCNEPSEEAKVVRIMARFAKRVPLTDVQTRDLGDGRAQVAS